MPIIMKRSGRANSDQWSLSPAAVWYKVLAVWYVLHNHIASNLEDVKRDRKRPPTNAPQHLAADAQAGSNCPLENSGSLVRGFECACDPQSPIREFDRFGSILVALAGPDDLLAFELELSKSVDQEEFKRLNGIAFSPIWANQSRKSQYRNPDLSQFVRQTAKTRDLGYEDWTLHGQRSRSEVMLQLHKFVKGQLKERPDSFPIAESRDCPHVIILTANGSIRNNVLHPLQCKWWPGDVGQQIECDRSTRSSLKCWKEDCRSTKPPRHHNLSVRAQKYHAISISACVTPAKDEGHGAMKLLATQVKIGQDRGVRKKPLAVMSL